MYNRFGPIPRICFDYLRREAHLNEHRRRFETSLSELSARHFLEMVHAARNFQLDDVSHIFILVRRRGRLSQGLSTVEPITVAVESDSESTQRGNARRAINALPLPGERRREEENRRRPLRIVGSKVHLILFLWYTHLVTKGHFRDGI